MNLSEESHKKIVQVMREEGLFDGEIYALLKDLNEKEAPRLPEKIGYLVGDSDTIKELIDAINMIKAYLEAKEKGLTEAAATIPNSIT